ncbi:unnamed protein product [Brachionus calyciflorus]|uniref:Calpain catalytic domain-containing protein n=1 Tax=Brachionus calyciflorus TaxID=104777 RepID=A0A814CLC2_9BILA|nr:unnamed protein product [Brachionus calyciflorus]
MVFKKTVSFDVSSIKSFKDQNYEELKYMYNEDYLFEDPFFPACNESLFHSNNSIGEIQWMRPREASENPQFVVDGFGRCDMDQGNLGNCWFIAACVGIMQSPKLFAKVVPEDQSFDENYAGIFHFRFWLYGEWVDVVIDDRLPFYPNGKLVYCSNKEQPNEFWGPLLEKAYAKLYGSYENLDAGQTYDALIDMSGGVPECFDIKSMNYKEKSNFWNILNQSYKMGSIISCSINADHRTREAIQHNGLVRGHAYTVTNLALVETKFGRSIKLTRIRNPWGNHVEWRGAWSDNSAEWFSLSEETKEELEFTKCHDGEFWMSFDDFLNNWHVVQFCHLNLESFSEELLQTDDDSDLFWQCTTFQSEWRTGISAGGCGATNPYKYWKNPQFIISLQDVDKDDNEDLATVIISLMQKDTRLKRISTGEESNEEYIQFRLYKVKDDIEIDHLSDCHEKLYAHQLERVGSSGSYINSREITKRFRVSPGNYLIIPSTYDEDRDCEFMLRIYTEQLIETKDLEENKEDLNEDETFFGNYDPDNIDWIKFIDNSDEQIEYEYDNYDDEMGSYKTNYNFDPYFRNRIHIKESCNLM